MSKLHGILVTRHVQSTIINSKNEGTKSSKNYIIGSSLLLCSAFPVVPITGTSNDEMMKKTSFGLYNIIRILIVISRHGYAVTEERKEINQYV